MKNVQADLIREIAVKIIDLSEGEGNPATYIGPIERAQDDRQFRAAIFRAVKAHYQNGEPEPLIGCVDYLGTLFPENQPWYEARDFLMICLYERLHRLRADPERISSEPFHHVAESELGSIDIITL